MIISHKLSLTAVVLSLLTASVFANGAEGLWARNCASCHGTDGKGDTKIGKRLGARDYTDPKVQESITDGQMFKSTKEGLVVDGKVRMKPFAGTLSDAEIKALVEYIRTFKR